MTAHGPIESEYLGVIGGYHVYTGHRRQPLTGRLVCEGYRAELHRGRPCDGGDVWFDSLDDLRDALIQIQVTP